MRQPKVKDVPAAKAKRRPWVRPMVKTTGTVAEVLQGGGGKLSIQADDSGDPPRKPKGLG